MKSKVQILNIGLDNLSDRHLLEVLKKGFVLTPNIDHLVRLQKDFEFYQIYQSADWIICDSQILSFCSRFLPGPTLTAIPGSSFFTEFCLYHKHNENIRIFLMGSALGVAEMAKIKINERIGRSIVVGACSPSFGFESNVAECNQLVGQINSSKANVLVVGVGSPKQEKWIYNYKHKLGNIDIFLPLGATIDFEAGFKKRAPKVVQKAGFEWLFRIFQEPRRLSRRYFIDDLPFFSYFLKQILGKYKNPFNESEFH